MDGVSTRTVTHASGPQQTTKAPSFANLISGSGTRALLFLITPYSRERSAIRDQGRRSHKWRLLRLMRRNSGQIPAERPWHRRRMRYGDLIATAEGDCARDALS